MTLGIFDSGIGGLSFIKKLLKVGFRDFIYLKDSKNFPYGVKSKDSLFKIGYENIKLLLKHGAHKIVIACHTMSNAASGELKIAFPSLQILNVLDPTLDRLKNNYQNKHILLIGTKTTIDLGIYKTRLAGISTFYEMKANDLVRAIEDYDIEGIKAIVSNKITNYIEKNSPIETILLACTHFSLVKKIVQKYNPKINVLDPVDFLLSETMKIIDLKASKNDSGVMPKYYTTQKSGPVTSFDSNELKKLNLLD